MLWFLITLQLNGKNHYLYLYFLFRVLKHFVLSCLPIPGDKAKTRENVTDLVKEILNFHGLDISNIYFVTDEGTNVVHLGGDKHLRCIAHILATISRHITQPYADDQPRVNVLAVESAINELHSFIADLRFLIFFNSINS